jgi:hypothetical protein
VLVTLDDEQRDRVRAQLACPAEGVQGEGAIATT